MSAGSDFRCERCGRSDTSPLGVSPFPDQSGDRIASSICVECWEAWKKHQMALINHYGLVLRDASARQFLRRSMDAFLFGGDAEAGVGDPV